MMHGLHQTSLLYLENDEVSVILVLILSVIDVNKN